MDDKEAIKYLKWIRPIRPYSLDKIKVQESIDLAIKTLEGRPQGEWIPVSERLPKKDDDYLITYVSYGREKVVSKSWFNTCNGFIYDNVIAWQPLPEPYKEEDEENG